MRTFRYTGLTATGERTSGLIEGESEKDALQKLADRSIFAERLESLLNTPRKGMTETQRAVFFRGLSALLKAGLPLDRALTLWAGEENSALQETVAPIREAVCEGTSFAAAMAAAEPHLTAYERAMLEAAERTGALAEMMLRMADFQDSRRAVLESLRSAMTYPAFVLFLGIAVAFFMLGFLVPTAQQTLSSAGIALPRMSLLIVSGARLLAWILGALLLLLTLTGATLSIQCRKSHTMRKRVGKWLLALPFPGRALRALAAQRFAETLSTLIRAGVPLVEGFSLAGSATGNAWVADEAATQAEAIRNGCRISEGISGLTALASFLHEWTRVGEAGGCLEPMLDVAADRAHAVWQRTCDRTLALVGPIVLVTVGLFVLAVALAVLLPVTAMTLSVG